LGGGRNEKDVVFWMELEVKQVENSINIRVIIGKNGDNGSS